MKPLASHQGAHGRLGHVAAPQFGAQSHSKPGSSASFASMSGGGHYVQGNPSAGGSTRKRAKMG